MKRFILYIMVCLGEFSWSLRLSWLICFISCCGGMEQRDIVHTRRKTLHVVPQTSQGEGHLLNAIISSSVIVKIRHNKVIFCTILHVFKILAFIIEKSWILFACGQSFLSDKWMCIILTKYLSSVMRQC